MEFKLLKRDALDEINQALDLYSRILCGQYDRLMDFYMENYSKEEVKSLLLSLRKICIPKLNTNLSGSLGIWNLNTPLKAIKSYDIYQILRYQIAYHENPSGGITVNFNPPYICGDWDIHQKEKEVIYDIIQRFKYPNYSKGKGWDCPLAIVRFDDELNVLTIIGNLDAIDPIIDESLSFYRNIKNKKLKEAFSILYPHMYEKDKESMFEYIKLIEQFIN